MRPSIVRALPLLLALAAPLQAQMAKKPITQDVYDLWRTIQQPTLSPDGSWAGFTISPVVGDGEAVIRSTTSATEYRVARGWTGRPVNSVQVDSPFVSQPIQFSADSRFAALLTYAPKSEFDRVARAPRGRGAAAQQPRNSLSIVALADGRVTKVERVRTFRMARESGKYLVYQLESDIAAAARDSAATGRAPGQGAQGGPAGAPGAPNARRRQPGTALVIRELATGTETRIDDVSSFTMDDSARVLAYAVTSRDSTKDGVFVRVLESGTTTPVLTGPGSYRQLAVDRAGTQLAFVSDRDEFPAEKARFTLYHTPLRAPKAVAAVAAGSIDGLSPVDRGRLEFTRDGSAVLFGIAPPPMDTIPADSLADKAVYDLWHWKDSRLQPQQRLDAQRDRNRAFTALWHVKSRRAVRLADDSIPNVNVVSDDARIALGLTNLPYAIQSMWGDGGNDVWLIDATSGKRTRIAEKLEFQAQLSPAAKYVVWFDQGKWWSYATATGKKADLTGALKGVRFDQETWDSPSTPAPWGLGGWTRNDASLLVYDRYDIWDVDPSGARAPRMVTDSVGVKSKLVLRAVDLDAEDRFIDPSKPLLLRAFDDETKASGFYRDRLGVAAAPERVVMADKAFGNPQRARKGETVLLTQSTVSEFPDLWAGPSVDRLAKISNANPQQSEYPWPSVELVNWLSDDGVPLKGLLYKPEGFDASKQYPMVVYYYETLSDNLHQYHAPAGRNTINPTVYTSLGYLVFFPDIVYTEGWPGPSAVKAIVPGVKSLIAKGYVNPKAVGIAGQSWGGYQSAYLITQTSLFAAAVPNAPVVNMTSAYGGIRWGTGIARPFQYEKTQSRIGGSLWEYPMRFIENSPLFQLDRVTTPVLFMHNDADDAVPWYQGIEFYVAMRRLNKEVYFITYNGDGHNPRKRANQKDIDLKMQQFFANKLQGAPPPDWMVKGIPYLEKGRDQVKVGPVVQP